MFTTRETSRDERGAAAVEYAVVTVAAASLGGVLIGIIGLNPSDPLIRPPVSQWLLEWMVRLLMWVLGQFGVS